MAARKSVKRPGRKSAPNTSRKRAAKKKARKAGRQTGETRPERKTARQPRGAARRSGVSGAGDGAPTKPGTGRDTPARARAGVGKERGRKGKAQVIDAENDE